MRFGLMVDPQEGLRYAEMRDLAVAAEAAGFESFFRSDHWLSLEGDWQSPATDAWTTLAGLARETRTIRLGTMVTPVTFRLPIALAKAVTTVDEMSEGRAELGLGAGWYAPEHERFGIPFPPRATRFEQLEETLQILDGLWTNEVFSFEGRHFRLEEAICEPKPVQKPRVPMIVGGYGRPKILRLAATYADELNLDTAAPEWCREVLPQLDDACRVAGRSPASVKRSAMLMWRAADESAPLETQLERFEAYEAAGIGRIVLDAWPGAASVAMIERFGRDVIPALAG